MGWYTCSPTHSHGPHTNIPTSSLKTYTVDHTNIPFSMQNQVVERWHHSAPSVNAAPGLQVLHQLLGSTVPNSLSRLATLPQACCPNDAPAATADQCRIRLWV